MKKCLVVFLILMVCGNHAIAQLPNLDTVKARLYQVNKIFDSSRYLSFDVYFGYSTDTAFGKFVSETEMARYVINRKHVYFSMGDDEYVQTDSFLFNIYKDDRTMVMSREVAIPVSNKFPLREFLDSIVTTYESAYDISVSESDSVHKIIFAATADSLPYSRFEISYMADSYLPLAFELETLADPDYADIPDSVLVRVAIKKIKYRVRMSFDNYSFPDDPNVFKISNYVTYDRFRRVYKPAPKYQGFKLMTSGVGASDFDVHAELVPPPEETLEPF